MGQIKDSFKDEYKSKVSDVVRDMKGALNKVDADNPFAMEKISVSLHEYLDIFDNLTKMLRGL